MAQNIGRPGTPRPPVSEDLRVRRALRNLSSIQAGLGTISSGLYSALPAPGTLGSVFLPSDSPGVLFDNGQTWDFILYENGRKSPVIKLADYSWVHQNGAIASQQGSSLLLQNGTNGVSLFIKPIPTPANPWFFQARPIIGMSNTASSGTNALVAAGICVSDGTKFQQVSFQQTTTGQAAIVNGENWTDFATFSATIVDAVSGNNLNELVSAFPTAPQWLMLDTLDGHLNFRAGGDSINYVTLAQTTKTAFLTPAYYGFFFRAGAGNPKLFATFNTAYEG